jgi:hypothetical protein
MEVVFNIARFSSNLLSQGYSITLCTLIRKLSCTFILTEYSTFRGIDQGAMMYALNNLMHLVVESKEYKKKSEEIK